MTVVDVSKDSFGERVRSTRLRRGLTTAQLATELSVVENTVHDWEKRGAIPREANAFKLARVLDVDILWLLEGRSEP